MGFPILAALVLMCFAADAATTTVVALIADRELIAPVAEDEAD